jgi:hypothetical protein
MMNVPIKANHDVPLKCWYLFYDKALSYFRQLILELYSLTVREFSIQPCWLEKTKSSWHHLSLMSNRLPLLKLKCIVPNSIYLTSRLSLSGCDVEKLLRTLYYLGMVTRTTSWGKNMKTLFYVYAYNESDWAWQLRYKMTTCIDDIICMYVINHYRQCHPAQFCSVIYIISIVGMVSTDANLGYHTFWPMLTTSTSQERSGSTARYNTFHGHHQGYMYISGVNNK